MAAEHQETSPEVAVPPPNEPFHPNETLEQTLNRLSGLINGTEGDPLKFWGEAKNRANTFADYYEVDAHKMTDAKLAELSRWIEEDQKRDNPYLTQAAEALISFWGKIKPEGQGHPGHDKRHFQKDLMAALEYRNKLVETHDPMGSYQKASLIGSFGHDMGRLIEPRVFGKPEGAEMGTNHPMLSFTIMVDILDHFKEVPADAARRITAKGGIPQELRDHILYAILSHQRWPTSEKEADKKSFPFIFFEPMPRSVMGADRLQLVGPEAIMRFFQFDVGVKPLDAPDKKARALDLATKIDPVKKEDITSNTDLAHHAEFFMRNLLPVFLPETLNPERQQEATDEMKVTREANRWIVQRAHDMRATTGIFLWLSSSDEAREQIFYPELANERGELTEEKKKQLAEKKKKLLPDPVWRQVKAVKDGGLDPQLEEKMAQRLQGRKEQDLLTLDDDTQKQVLHSLVRQFVQVPNAAITQTELDQITKKMDEITDKTARARMAWGLAYVMTKRDELEATQKSALTRMQQDTAHFPPNSLEATLAQFIINT